MKVHEGCATRNISMPLFDKPRTHKNSIKSYHKLDLTTRQAEIVEALKIIGRATDAKIATFLKVSINRVTGRIRELIDKGLVEEIDTVVGEFGKKVRVCRLKD